MKCPVCHKRIHDGDAFCGFCGANLRNFPTGVNSTAFVNDQKLEFAKDKLIGSFGNKELAVNAFIEHYNVSPREANKFINDALKQVESQILNERDAFTEDLAVRVCGNRFKAIRELKDRYGIDNNEAAKCLNKALKKVGPQIEAERTSFISNALLKEHKNEDTVVGLVMERYGLFTMEASDCVHKCLTNIAPQIDAEINSVIVDALIETDGDKDAVISLVVNNYGKDQNKSREMVLHAWQDYETRKQEERNNFTKEALISLDGNKQAVVDLLREQYDLDSLEANKLIDKEWDNYTNQLVNSICNYAKEALIDNDGNKFSTIKQVRERFGIGIDDAAMYVNQMWDELNGSSAIAVSNTALSVEPLPIVPVTNDEHVEESHKPYEIEYTKIIGTDTRKGAISAVGRGVVGGMLIGPVGLIAAASAKNKHKTTFLVVRYSGEKEAVTVKDGSREYNHYISFLKAD